MTTNAEQNITGCFRTCSKTDLDCQEKCIDNYNQTIKETFTFSIFSRLQLMAILSALVCLLIKIDIIRIPSEDLYIQSIYIAIIYFVLYILVKKNY